MDKLEIQFARKRKGLTRAEVASALGISTSSYIQKETNKVKFKDSEKIALSRLLSLSPYQTNDFLFDGVLPLEEWSIFFKNNSIDNNYYHGKYHEWTS